MKFDRLEMLFLIWALPLLLLIVIHGMRRRKKILLQFAQGKGLEYINSESSLKQRWIKVLLLFISILFMVFAIMGPQYGYRWLEIEQKGVDIIVALDCSKSMLAKDVSPSRISRAKMEVSDLLTMLKGDRIGLVAFAGTSFLQCPLTTDYNAFYLFLDTLNPGFLPVGGTDISGAIETAVSAFNNGENSQKAIIMITDGETNEGDKPETAIEIAKKENIKVFCIGIGDEAGVPIPDEAGGFQKDKYGNIVVTRLDENLLRKIADMTGGAYIKSELGDIDLKAIYEKEIRGKMDAVTLKGGKRKIMEDRFQWFVIISILAFVAELFIPSTKKATLIVLMVGLMLLCHATANAGNAYDSVEKGISSYEKGDYQAALKHFIDAQIQDPDSREISYNLGNTYYKIKDYDSALKNYSEVLKGKDESLKEEAHYNMGNANFRKQMLKEAIEEYKKALRIDPKDDQAKENLEFAKKMLEEQKNKEKENQSKEEISKEKDDQKQEKQEQKSSEEQSNKDKDEKEKDNASGKKEGKQNPEYGSEMNNSDQKKAAIENLTKKTDSNKSDHGIGKPQQGEQDVQKQQAQQMLNRLKDMPGKAMVPSYGPREVEKDW